MSAEAISAVWRAQFWDERERNNRAANKKLLLLALADIAGEDALFVWTEWAASQVLLKTNLEREVAANAFKLLNTDGFISPLGGPYGDIWQINLDALRKASK
jgi:hypothetical protein